MSIADKIADRLVSKAAVAGLDRLDLSIQDYTVLADAHSARILIGFDRRQACPTIASLERFVQAKFDGRLHVEASTALWHKDAQSPCVSVIVATARKTREFNDRKGLVPVIANTLYLDQTINANWEVKTNDAGKKILVCVRDEDVPGLLQSAKAKYATASFTGSQTAVGFILPEKGDFVEFFADGGLRQGQVNKVKDNEASIVEEDGTTHLVDIPSITRMLKKNAKSLTKQQEQLVQALIPTMGSRELAEKLVRGN